MASLPDGIVVAMRSIDKGTGIEFKVIENLIKCKNCLFCEIKDIELDRDTTIKDAFYCEEYEKITNPEGYCFRAFRKDALDG